MLTEIINSLFQSRFPVFSRKDWGKPRQSSVIFSSNATEIRTAECCY